ncbi:hypothetical protein LCGC14_2206440 [marine sediment metagenome]|uniref:Biopolymer transport protein ExbD/TolR n=1 Tax=marine sediment metagenome TaxID=412755 RepID=A0A0F9DF35_9ZZZZ
MPGYGYIRERRRDPEPSAKPQITSFADVTLVLLVVFLVSASAAVAMVKVSLPEAERTASWDINLAVTISLSKHKPAPTGGAAAPKPVAAEDKKTPAEEKDPWLFYFEDDTIGIEAKNLWMALKEIKRDNDWPMALIRGDKDAPGEHTAILVHCLQGLGVDKIGFVIKTETNK